MGSWSSSPRRGTAHIPPGNFPNRARPAAPRPPPQSRDRARRSHLPGRGGAGTALPEPPETPQPPGPPPARPGRALAPQPAGRCSSAVLELCPGPGERGSAAAPGAGRVAQALSPHSPGRWGSRRLHTLIPAALPGRGHGQAAAVRYHLWAARVASSRAHRRSLRGSRTREKHRPCPTGGKRRKCTKQGYLFSEPVFSMARLSNFGREI